MFDLYMVGAMKKETLEFVTPAAYGQIPRDGDQNTEQAQYDAAVYHFKERHRDPVVDKIDHGYHD